MAETLSREGGRIPPPLRGPPPFGKGDSDRRSLVLGGLPCEREGDRRRPVEGFPPTNSAQALGHPCQAERAEESPCRCAALPPLARGAVIDGAAFL